MNRRNEYHVSQKDGKLYTVVRWDEDGVATDLNEERELCTTRAELVVLIYDLESQGAYDDSVRLQLIEEVWNDIAQERLSRNSGAATPDNQ